MFPNFTDVTHYDFDICPPFFIVLVQGKDLLLRIAGPQIFTTEGTQSYQIHQLSPKFPASLGAWTRLTLTDVAILELSNRFLH